MSLTGQASLRKNIASGSGEARLQWRIELSRRATRQRRPHDSAARWLQPINPFLPGTDAKAGVLEIWATGSPVVGVCPLIDMEQVFSVAGAPTPSSGPGGTHRVPIRCPGDICQALVETGFIGIVGCRVGGG